MCRKENCNSKFITTYFGGTQKDLCLKMNCIEITQKLNRLHRLRRKGIKTSKAYRLSKLNRWFKDLLDEASQAFELIELSNLKSYEDLLGPQPALPLLLKRKEEAVKATDYELAAQLRKQEKEYLKAMLIQEGFDPKDHFFCKENKIYFKLW